MLSSHLLGLPKQPFLKRYSHQNFVSTSRLPYPATRPHIVISYALVSQSLLGGLYIPRSSSEKDICTSQFLGRPTDINILFSTTTQLTHFVTVRGYVYTLTEQVLCIADIPSTRGDICK